MTTKELIRAEIERMHQQSVIAAVGNETDWLRSRIGTLVDVMDILDTLPDEPVTDCNDLEKEIKEQIYDRFYDLNGIAVIGTSGYAEVKDMEYIARHFAEWQKRKMMGDSLEKPTCKSCGFYENDCPFIRGKFMPYPNIVCKDYTSSIIRKEDEQ